MPQQPPPTWTVHAYGSSSIDGSGAGYILTPPEGGDPLRYALVLTFKATNNEAEYEAFITGLQLSRWIGAVSTKV